MLEKLEYLLALARERNFGKAAESCGVTQPSFSTGIKQLEDALGATLVQRTSRFIGFTAEGERVLEWARGIIADTRSMKSDVQTLKKGLTGHLRIAAMPVVLPMLARLTTSYHDKYPGVRFSLLSRTTAEILGMLDNLEIDAGIIYIDAPLPRGLRAVPFYRERYRLVTAPDNPLGNREKVTWAEVARIPLCLPVEGMHIRTILDGLLKAAGGEVRPPPVESDSMAVLFTHVRTGRWATVMPDKLADALGVTQHLRSIPIVEPDAVHEIGLVLPKREPSTAIVSALVAEAKVTAQSL